MTERVLKVYSRMFQFSPNSKFHCPLIFFGTQVQPSLIDQNCLEELLIRRTTTHRHFDEGDLKWTKVILKAQPLSCLRGRHEFDGKCPNEPGFTSADRQTMTANAREDHKNNDHDDRSNTRPLPLQHGKQRPAKMTAALLKSETEEKRTISTVLLSQPGTSVAVVEANQVDLKHTFATFRVRRARGNDSSERSYS